MGNCCAAVPTSDSSCVHSTANERENPLPAEAPPSTSHSVGYGANGGGHMTPDSLPELMIPSEPQQLEHMADREGQDKNNRQL